MNGGLCKDKVNKFKCQCGSQYEGTQCEIDTSDDCRNNPCGENGFCTDRYQSYRCICREGFRGDNCETDVRTHVDCSSTPCGSYGAECENTPDDFVGYKCSCLDGWGGLRCNEDLVCGKILICVNGGVCLHPPNARCFCSHAYTGPTCALRNLCRENPCENGATCRVYGSELSSDLSIWRCECPPDWSGSTCNTYIGDKCVSSPCAHGGTCSDIRGERECTCIQGYVGRDCELDRNECRESGGAMLCLNGGVCVNTEGAYRCDCMGTNHTGFACSERISKCTINQDICHNGGRCTEIQVPPYELYCICTAGWTGNYCDTNINECQSNPCAHGRCEDLLNSYICNCTMGWTGTTCDIDTICTSTTDNPCNEETSVLGGCLRFEYPYDHDYKCTCKPGYTGKLCDMDIDECFSQPCQNDGICTDHTGNFTCSCNNDTSGEFCEIAKLIQQQVLCESLQAVTPLPADCQDWFIITGVIGFLVITIMCGGCIVSLVKSAEDAKMFKKMELETSETRYQGIEDDGYTAGSPADLNSELLKKLHSATMDATSRIASNSNTKSPKGKAKEPNKGKLPTKAGIQSRFKALRTKMAAQRGLTTFLRGRQPPFRPGAAAGSASRASISAQAGSLASLAAIPSNMSYSSGGIFPQSMYAQGLRPGGPRPAAQQPFNRPVTGGRLSGPSGPGVRQAGPGAFSKGAGMAPLVKAKILASKTKASANVDSRLSADEAGEAKLRASASAGQDSQKGAGRQRRRRSSVRESVPVTGLEP